MKTLSVVIPCYNEEKNLPLLVEKFASCEKQAGFELVLVNNGSTDGSARILATLAKKHKFIKIATIVRNEGYGNGIRFGLRQARGDFLAWTHADLQADPADVFRAFDLVKDKPNPENFFVKGQRRNRPFFDEFFTIGMSGFCSLVLGARLWDINAQPTLFYKSFLKLAKNPPKDFSFDPYFYYIAQKNGLEILRFPVDFGKRLYGESHWNVNFLAKLKFIKRTIDFTLKLRRRLHDDYSNP